MKITSYASILILLTAAMGCGNSGNKPRPAAEFEQLRGADVARAKQLYGEGRTQEGAALLRDLVADRDWNVRSHAVRAIGEVADRSLLPEVHAALTDDRLEVRESAGRILISMGDASSLVPLRKALSDKEGIIRSHAAEALITIGGVGELPAIADIVENDADPTVRASTARALGGIRDPAVLPLLAAALEDESAMVRGEAAEAIGTTGLTGGRKALEKVAAGDPDAGVRERAGAALRRLEANTAPNP